MGRAGDVAEDQHTDGLGGVGEGGLRGNKQVSERDVNGSARWRRAVRTSTQRGDMAERGAEKEEGKKERTRRENTI